VFAAGYQGTVVFPLDGAPVEGTIVEDTPDHLTLRKSDASTVTIQRNEIDVIKPGLSAMPTNHAEHLSREEMRDLIEFLATL
jgi:putative heme-binding domain-containing protein